MSGKGKLKVPATVILGRRAFLVSKKNGSCSESSPDEKPALELWECMRVTEVVSSCLKQAAARSKFRV